MISEGELAGMLEMTRSLRKGFAGTAPRRWNAATAGAELTVQLGHVAMCLARRHGFDVSAYADPGRPITDPGDELADVALALLSIGVLSDAPPSLVPSGPAGAAASETEALLVLLICAGQAAEAGLVRAGYRHQPTGSPAPIPQACGTALQATDQLARLLDLDLAGEFASMYQDATGFLSAHPSGDLT
jgi:hypothetical protein